MYEFFKECENRGIDVKRLQDKMLIAARTRHNKRYEKKWLGLRTKEINSPEWLIFDLKPIEIDYGKNNEKGFMLVYTDENGIRQEWNGDRICHHDDKHVYTAVTLSAENCFNYLKEAKILVDVREGLNG